MKRGLFFIVISFSWVVVVNSQAIIQVNNSLNNARNEVISIPWSDVLINYPTVDTANFVVINLKTKKQLLFQLEHNGKAQVQNLLIQIDIAAKENLQLKLQKGKTGKFTAKTYCRYVPERKDDFAWENDKIAFRMYGKALEGTNENAYGMDVWVKRTERLILNERYKRNEYHIDHGDGMDYYNVGFSLGAGSAAPFISDSIWYSNNYRRWKVLDNGPLRSTFQLEYDEWNVASIPVTCIKTISIDAGSQLSKIEVKYSTPQAKTLPIAVGIVKRKQAGVELFDEQNGIMGYWEPTAKKDGTTGVGCIFPTKIKSIVLNKQHLLSIFETNVNESMIYYSGAAWDKAGTITSAQKWFDYLDGFKQKLDSPLKIMIKKF